MNGERIRDELPLRALSYGEGTFETFRFNSTLPVLFNNHIERMREGAELLGIPILEKQYISDLVSSAISESGISDAYVKVCLLSEGNTPFYEYAEKAGVLVIVKEYSVSPEPVKARLCSFRRNSDSPLIRIKSLNYLENILARRQATASGCDEALFLNERNEIAEGSASNVFWVKDSVLFTPSIDCGVLPGVTRSLLVDYASEIGFELREGRYLLQELIESEFAFFTNALTGLRQIKSVNHTNLPIDNPAQNAIRNFLFRTLLWE